jgi:ATP-binding cassette subfamily F protein uup
MALIVLSDARLAFGHVDLLAGCSMSLDSGQRIGLIGRNGTGKSSLLKIIAGLERLDDGTLQLQRALRIAYVAQEPILDPDESVFEAVSHGVDQARRLRQDYEALSAEDPTPECLERMHDVQVSLEALGGWTWEQRVAETLDRLHLEGARRVGALSGGLKKRVALAQALVALPDVLLLDEPTNHLDIDSIRWLEGLLNEFSGAIIFITHDRAFLNAVCTHILELDRGRLRLYPGDFSTYQKTKEQELSAEALANAREDKLLAQEEVWIRKGVEARRTRSVGRIARLEALRDARQARREQVGKVKLELAAAARSGKIVANLESVSKSYDHPVVRDFSATILRGDKVGLIGPNGAGKTTLLKLLLGVIPPDTGTVTLGTKIEVAYFDQMREGVDLDATLEDFISPGSEWIEIAGARKHVKSYLGDFLFAPERAASPVRSLSGGERNRLFLARLFAKPANVLVLDEPTNDLDIETLDLLEELLQQTSATVFLVSHDRAFIDNVVTSLIAYEGNGTWREFEGGYQDWETWRTRVAAESTPALTTRVKREPMPSKSAVPATSANALSTKERRELDLLPEKIDTLEARQAELERALGDPELYTTRAGELVAIQEEFQRVQEQIQQAMSRWELLLARAEPQA